MGIRGKQTGVLFAEPYWNYVEKLPDSCPVAGGSSEDSKFGYACSKKLMEELGIDTTSVDKCVMDTKDEKLKEQRNHQAWSPKALRINGWRYTGMLDADLVTRAVCAGFTSKPKECQDLIAPRNPLEVYGKSRQDGIGIIAFVSGLICLAVLLCLSFLCYRRRLKSNIQNSIREEVMLEVQCQMASYSKLGGEL